MFKRLTEYATHSFKETHLKRTTITILCFLILWRVVSYVVVKFLICIAVMSAAMWLIRLIPLRESNCAQHCGLESKGTSKRRISATAGVHTIQVDAIGCKEPGMVDI